jgi:diacylglycerol kinase (ATP)
VSSGGVRQALVVYSPVSGNAHNLDERLGYIVRKLCEDKRFVANVRPLRPGIKGAELFTPELGEFDLVIACGGDGTVRNVLGAMAELKHKAPVAIVPFGTGNLLAKSLGIWPTNQSEDPVLCAIDVIHHGETIPMDLGKMNGNYFVVDAGIGPISNAIVAPNPRFKRTFKMLAYILPLLKAMSKRSLECHFIIDDKEHFYRNASGIFVTNASDMGIGRDLDAEQFTDGWLDLCIMNPLSPLQYFKIAYRFGAWFLGGFVSGPPPYLVRKVKKVRIETDRTASAMVDGDRCCSTPIEIEVVPNAVNLLVPRAIARTAYGAKLDQGSQVA